ncbi:hypothetical protein diail_12128 [Diaporthe ilicicola]|nr:hypothetical protein diail_12128 [Diaporthe ilicicola]
MTPKKGTKTNRDPTLVFPTISPELTLAYRIFGPGQEEVKVLDKQLNAIISSESIGADEEPVCTPLGEDIKKSLNMNLDQILEAFEAYKNEIKRMNKIDRIHLKRKLAQCDGANDADEDESDGVEEIDPNADSSDDENDDDYEWDSDEDPYEQYYADPALWLSKETALARQGATLASLRSMKTALDDLQAYYAKNLTSSKVLEQAFKNSAINLDTLTRYAEKVEQIIMMHKNKCPRSTWKSRDRMNVTFGEKVPWIIDKVYDLEDRIEGMQSPLAAARRARLRLASTRVATTAKDMREELRAKLVQFAAMCFTHQTRAEFKERLKQEAKEWEEQPESSKDQPKKKRSKYGTNEYLEALFKK